MDYKISVEPAGEAYRNIEIEIPRAVYSKKFDDAVNRASSKVRLKGFRPGHAPKAMVAKLYGTELHQEVMEGLANTALREAVKKHELNIVGSPQVKFGEDSGDNDLQITANVAVYPTPKIEGYDALKLEVEVRSFKEEDVDKEIDSYREQRADFKKIEDRTKAQKDDFALVEYSAEVDGEPFPSDKKEKRFVQIGSKMLPEELDAALAGAEVGKPVEVEVPISADYAEKKFAGKTAKYSIVITELSKKELPELNDEFAKAAGAEDLAGLRAQVKTNLEKALEDQNTQAKERKLFEAIIEKNPFDVPQVMVDDEMRNILFEMGVLDRRSRKSYEMDMTPFRKPLEKQAEYRVKSIVVLDRIVEQEKVEPTKEELESWLDGLVSKGGFKSREELNKQVGYPDGAERLKSVLAREKITENLLAKAKIKEVPWKEKSPEDAEAESAGNE